ncbi:hypothetical protein AZI86_05435 [Bdellovibrio bacteriovorus]|uniref:Flagellar hook protein FlgE/F/G-like D1 domain-containing protein n=2 Tax=Bdellovibrio bacteriovorus TaxID=959 RepID=A0A150WPY7_BDEBC|nr:hypothetical protein AZI86_05435 [Bdellovibrio bacteriovorus]
MILLATLVVLLLFLLDREIEVSVATGHASNKADWPANLQTAVTSLPVTQKNSPPKSNNDINKDDNESEITSDQIELLCKLRSAKTSVPMSGKIQVFVSKISPFLGMNEKNVAWIKSPSCPDGYYSIVHYSDEGDVTKEIDCRRASLTELGTFSGEQGNIIDAPADENTANLAISGAGYFVLQCPDSKLMLTRNGKFKRSARGILSNGGDCTLLDTQGRPFIDEKINFEGCNTQGACVATLDPSLDETEGLEYVNSYTFQADAAITPELSVTKKGSQLFRPNFFLNSLENIHDSDRGMTSVSWINHPSVDLDRLECP